jgi:guanylate kinase
MKKAIIFSAPSGAGKTTIVHHLLKVFPELCFSVSACSRQKRANEVDGKDYYFLGIEGFKMNKTVIFDVDVVGGLNLKKLFDEKALAVFVKAPSIEELEKRLKSRQTESNEKIAIRIQKAKHEMAYEKEFDVALVNVDLEHSLPEAEKLVRDFLSK